MANVRSIRQRVAAPPERWRCEVGEAMDRHGYAVVGVGGPCGVPGCTSAHDDACWSYTVGLAERGLPEYVVTGLRPAGARPVLTWAAERALLGLAVDPGGGGVLRGVAVRADSVPPEWLGWDRTRMAVWWSHVSVGRRGPAVVQLVYADAQGRFPDEPGCDPLVARRQPLLAADPTAFPPRASRAARRGAGR